MEKQLYLFDPRTAERKLITYKLLSGITGRSIPSLRASKRNRCRLRGLGYYILERDTPLAVLRELLKKEIIDDEVWRKMPNSRWEVSSYGRYRSHCRKQDKVIYRLPSSQRTYSSATISIHIAGQKVELVAHQKVVELFIGDIPKGYVVYHKDGNKANNKVENLGFITRKKLISRQATCVQSKAIVQMDEITGNVVGEYRSLAEAAKVNFTSTATIRQAMKENRPAIGFKWITEDEYLENYCEQLERMIQ